MCGLDKPMPTFLTPSTADSVPFKATVQLVSLFRLRVSPAKESVVKSCHSSEINVISIDSNSMDISGDSDSSKVLGIQELQRLFTGQL